MILIMIWSLFKLWSFRGKDKDHLIDLDLWSRSLKKWSCPSMPRAHYSRRKTRPCRCRRRPRRRCRCGGAPSRGHRSRRRRRDRGRRRRGSCRSSGCERKQTGMSATSRVIHRRWNTLIFITKLFLLNIVICTATAIQSVARFES